MEFLNYNDHHFRINKKVKEHLVSNTKAIRQKVNADITVRKNNYLYFLEYIPEANVIEYKENTSIEKV